MEYSGRIFKEVLARLRKLGNRIIEKISIIITGPLRGEGRPKTLRTLILPVAICSLRGYSGQADALACRRHPWILSGVHFSR